MPTLTGFDILTVEIPMKISAEHALAKRKVARNVLVAAHDSEGRTGFGECCPRPYVTGETVESATNDLREHILPKLVGRRFSDPDDVATTALAILDGLARNQQAAFCAAELALLDLAGRAFGRSAGDFLGPVCRETVHYTGVIAANTADGVRTYAGLLAKFGARQAKLKVGADLDTNLQFLTIARAALGDDVELRIDANCAWDAKEAIRQLEAMAAFRLTGVEQPLPGDDIQGMREVTAAGITPVVADESLASLDDARQLVEQRACDIFNVRVSKVGGLLNAARIHRLAEDAGLGCQLGAQVGETGILSAAGRHYGTRCEGVRWFEGSYDSILLETVFTEPDITIGPGGRAQAMTGPGLGVTPNPEQLEACTTEKIKVG